MALLFPLTDSASSIPAGIAAKRAAAALHKPRVCGRTKDREARVVRVSDPLREGRGGVVSPLLISGPLLAVSSSSSLPPPPSASPPLRQQLQLLQEQREGGEDKQRYYVNMGYAIRTLREELPVIFYREPSFDIYRDDIVFKDPLNTFVGIDNYKLIFRALRFSGRIFFKALWVDIVGVWQPSENIIMIRWIAHGIPRVPWESNGRFDGTSEYKLDNNGKIFEHRVDNVAINNPPKFQVLAVVELIQSFGCPSTPKPTYFEKLLSCLISCMPFRSDSHG